MTREETRDEILKIESPYILAELPTSFGKTKIALDWVAKKLTGLNNFRILIVIPRLVLINNWKDEFKKWHYEEYLSNVEFVTYISLPKKLDKNYDVIIFDEVHHLSERCGEALLDRLEGGLKITYSIMLSATVSRTVRERLQLLFPNLYTHRVTTKQAIKDEVLPDPRVYLIPLLLNRTDTTFEIVKNKSQKIELRIPYVDKWKYATIKNRRIIISCTQRQYYDEMSSLITWYKKRLHNETFKNLFLRKSGERLKWLSEQKAPFIKELLTHLEKERTLTFCNGIPQTKELGSCCVNSEDSKQSRENLEKFNSGLVNHVTACNMLDEGMNLSNCRVGVYAVLNSSDRMIKQKLGRLLRHPDPIIVIPFFRGTREAEIVGTMLEDYNPELVTTITNLKELKL